MGNFRGEISIGGHESGSRIVPIVVQCKVKDVRKLQRVYSAAPVMLQALEWAKHHLLITHGLEGDEVGPIDDAIAKAKGEAQQSNDFKEALDDARYFPDGFISHLAKKVNIKLFIHSYPNLDDVLMGGGLIDRAEVIDLHDSLLITAKVRPKVKPDSHVFLGLIGFKGVVMGYVHSVKDGVALIQGMGGIVEGGG